MHKILIYNGFPFHYEMIGFMLDFCRKYTIEATLVNKVMNDEWIDLYKQKFNFQYLQDIPSQLNSFNLIVLLTDDDMSYPNHLIFNNTICIDHSIQQNRRPQVKYHIPIIPFHAKITDFILPVFDYITIETKIKKISEHKRPIITFLGDSAIPCDSSVLRVISNLHDFDIYIINRRIVNKNFNLPNVFFFENIPANHMFELLISSTYICYIPNKTSSSSPKHYECKSMTAAMPLSFTTGCKLIIPQNMNKFLKLNSVLEYLPYTQFSLELSPSLVETFQEREQLLKHRDTSLFRAMKIVKQLF